MCTHASHPYDVAIIGCGIVGAATAHLLSQYNLRTLVLEKENDISCGTTKANSGIIHAGYDAEEGTLMARLNIRGLALAYQLSQQLGFPLKNTGSLVVAYTEEDRKKLQILYRRGIANGVEGLRLLNQDETYAREPNLRKGAIAALYAPTAGVVEPWEYCLALAETAAINGVDVRTSHAVTAIAPCDDGFLITAGERFFAKYVVNAAGLYADEIARLIGDDSFRIHAVKGEYYLLDKTESDMVRHVVFGCPNEYGKGVLVAPTASGNIIVGPNAKETPQKDDVSTSKEGLCFVADSASMLVSTLDLQKNIRNFASLRAYSDRDDFIIEPSPRFRRFIHLAGIKSPGLTSAPAIAEEACKLLEASGLQLEKKTGYRHRRHIRFSTLSDAQKNALIKERPEYGHVICRCEGITEGEIIDAIHSPIPPKTLNGIKRRTGAALGRCQGGFCSPRTMEILAQELHIDLCDIQLDHDGSYILTGRTKA